MVLRSIEGGILRKIYDRDWGELPPRWEFIRKSTGPFTTVSTENIRYKEYIEKQMKKHFDREEKAYEGYTAPLYASWVAGFHRE